MGGAGLVYGLTVDAGGSPKQRGGPATYVPYAPRWLAALWALALTPAWGVLSLPLGVMFYSVLVVGGGVYGAVQLVRSLAATRHRE